MIRETNFCIIKFQEERIQVNLKTNFNFKRDSKFCLQEQDRLGYTKVNNLWSPVVSHFRT